MDLAENLLFDIAVDIVFKIILIRKVIHIRKVIIM